MRVPAARQDLVDQFAGTHRIAADEDRTAVRQLVVAVVEGLRDLFDPLLLFRTISEHEFE